MSLPGEQLIAKLWETLAEKGIGLLFKHRQIRREGLAQIEMKRAELLVMAQAQLEAESIKSGEKRLEDFSLALAFAPEKVSKSNVEDDGTTKLSHHIAEEFRRHTTDEYLRKEFNTAKAIFAAEEELKNDTQEPPSQNIDEDWLYRWRNYAGEVSSDYMQQLWGKILAGELKSPGACSLRTMDLLRNMSQEEATILVRCFQYVIGDFIWREGSGYIGMADLLKLQELGVLVGVDSIGMSKLYKSNVSDRFLSLLFSHGKAIIIQHDNPKTELKLNAYLLTSVGKQLQQISKCQPQIEYLKDVCRFIKKQGMFVSLADYRRDSSNEVECWNIEVIS